ncbi:MAG: enoyl-CoA hydratase [Anaerolineae bacterium CG_4_9_14_3_um_filter_57_17]|nr:enoyl-CoA hydratase [bacterium]NCT21435.1 enoyl-CoA hydratase [bacterium]OIO83150.1 MAG: enoyl-CoA hydratase [Anaerolineae bacterium CG2_30_57_67]PJB67371.1 MAG: enoyl-CoA hydratase [Anaerolineae bacterium CG_4_9_14_3_um_filter_57_17]
MSAALILTEVHGRVGLITLNRPQALNALNNALLAELGRALQAFDADSAIRAILLTGNERAFAAGADIKEMADASLVEMLTGGFVELFDVVPRIKKPLIAAVSGFALGGGCELALACDMIVASESAKFGLPEVTIGVIPGAGGTQRLTHALGKALAMEVILNNRVLSAAEAERFGLVNRVVPPERYLQEALALAEQVAARAPLAAQFAKQAVLQSFAGSLAEGQADERRLFYMLFATADQKEGMKAFLEKRKPNWQGK